VHRERAGLKSHFRCVFYGVLQIPTRGTLLKERLKMSTNKKLALSAVAAAALAEDKKRKKEERKNAQSKNRKK